MNDGSPAPAAATASGSALTVLRRLLPTVWHYRGRVLLGLALVVGTKLALVGLPLVLKELIDALNLKPTPLTVPVALLMTYGALRLASSVLQELRNVVFARVMARSSREVALRV
ncbi:metal ABC transporter permease, partial [Xanthomonas citri pv. citri]